MRRRKGGNMTKGKSKIASIIAMFVFMVTGLLFSGIYVGTTQNAEIDITPTNNIPNDVYLSPTSIPVTTTPVFPSNQDDKFDVDISITPMGDFASLLPNYPTGKWVDLNTYKVRINPSWNNSLNRLLLTIDLENYAEHPIDVKWAFQLRDEGGALIQPTTDRAAIIEPTYIEAGTSQTFSLLYSLDVDTTDMDTTQSDNGKQELLFAPRGWSGPVVFFAIPLQEKANSQ